MTVTPPGQEDEAEEAEAGAGPGVRGDGPVCVRDPETDEVSVNVTMRPVITSLTRCSRGIMRGAHPTDTSDTSMATATWSSSAASIGGLC